MQELEEEHQPFREQVVDEEAERHNFVQELEKEEHQPFQEPVVDKQWVGQEQVEEQQQRLETQLVQVFDRQAVVSGSMLEQAGSPADSS